jgi:hypothetical protein
MGKMTTLVRIRGSSGTHVRLAVFFMENLHIGARFGGPPLHSLHPSHSLHGPQQTSREFPPDKPKNRASACGFVELRAVKVQKSPHWQASSVGLIPLNPFNPSHSIDSIRSRENSRSSWSVGPTGCGWNDRDPHIGGRFRLGGMAGVPILVGAFSGSHPTQSIQSISFH